MVCRWTPWSTGCCTKLEPMSSLSTLSRPMATRLPVGIDAGSCARLQPSVWNLASGGGAAAAAAAGRGRVNPQGSSRICQLALRPKRRGLVARQFKGPSRHGRSAFRPEGFAEDEVLPGVVGDNAPGSNCSTAQLWLDGVLSGGFRGNSSGSNLGVAPLWQQLRWVLVNKQGAMGAMAVMMLLLGLQMCPAAWAGTEVAQINANFGLFDLGDWSDIQSGFAGAFLLIFFSEIGDKTFFIAALLATRKSGVAVFSGTFGALVAMTVISVSLGRVFHYIDGILPSFGDTRLPVDDIAAVILLIYFGVSTLTDAANMEDDTGEEQQEAELAIANVGAGGAVAGTVAATFALVFVAEWGDKSFFSTIALAAASSPLGVVSGAIAGHGAATLLAVLGGSILGNYVSEKVIAYVGGVLFLVFAGATLVEILY